MKANSSSKFLTFLANPWVVGIILLLYGLLTIPTSIAGGTLILLTGLVLMPPINSILVQKSNLPVLGNKYVLAAIAIPVVVIGNMLTSSAEFAAKVEAFKKEKPAIVSQIDGDIKAGKYAEAEKAVSKYLNIVPSDSDLSGLKEKLYREWAPKLKSEMRKELAAKKLDAAEALLKQLKLNPKSDAEVTALEKQLGDEKAKLEAALKAKREQEETERKKRAEKEAAERDRLTACASDYTKCADNEMLVNHYKGMAEAKAACQIQAENLAKWGTPQWDWSKFGTFFTGTNYVTDGVVRLVDNQVKFQNGFGAYGRVEVECHYDLKAKTVDAVFTR